MEDIEKRVIGKVMWRLIPFLIVCYFVAYLDRVNVGFAKLHMNQALGLSEAAFGLGAGLFFIGYFLFEVPSNHLPGKGRRAGLDRPHHDHLGHRLGGVRLHPVDLGDDRASDERRVLLPAPAARRLRGRLLSRASSSI